MMENSMEYARTITEDSLQNKIRIYNAINNAASLADMTGEVMQIVDIIVEPGKRSARGNNPEQPCRNTYLITADGNAYFSQSDGIARTAMELVKTFGNDLNKPEGLPVVVKEQSLKSGNKLKVLEIVI